MRETPRSVSALYDNASCQATDAAPLPCNDTPEFAVPYLAFKREMRSLIDAIAAWIRVAVSPSSPDVMIEDLHWDLIDNMKGLFGANAANNSSDDESDQEAACSNAEAWVTDNLSIGDIDEDIAMAFFLHGTANGFVLIRNELGLGDDFVLEAPTSPAV